MTICKTYQYQTGLPCNNNNCQLYAMGTYLPLLPSIVPTLKGFNPLSFLNCFISTGMFSAKVNSETHCSPIVSTMKVGSMLKFKVIKSYILCCLQVEIAYQLSITVFIIICNQQKNLTSSSGIKKASSGGIHLNIPEPTCRPSGFTICNKNLRIVTVTSDNKRHRQLNLPLFVSSRFALPLIYRASLGSPTLNCTLFWKGRYNK